MSVIKVQFKDNYKLKYQGKSYQYLCDQQVSLGSFVVVDTPSEGYVIVKVVEIDVKDTKATKSIVCVVDDAKYKAEVELEMEVKSTLAKLEQAAQRTNKLALYKVLAETSPEVADLYSKLEKLGGVK